MWTLKTTLNITKKLTHNSENKLVVTGWEKEGRRDSIEVGE